MQINVFYTKRLSEVNLKKKQWYFNLLHENKKDMNNGIKISRS